MGKTHDKEEDSTQTYTEIKDSERTSPERKRIESEIKRRSKGFNKLKAKTAKGLELVQELHSLLSDLGVALEPVKFFGVELPTDE